MGRPRSYIGHMADQLIQASQPLVGNPGAASTTGQETKSSSSGTAAGEHVRTEETDSLDTSETDDDTSAAENSMPSTASLLRATLPHLRSEEPADVYLPHVPVTFAPSADQKWVKQTPVPGKDSTFGRECHGLLTCMLKDRKSCLHAGSPAICQRIQGWICLKPKASALDSTALHSLVQETCGGKQNISFAAYSNNSSGSNSSSSRDSRSDERARHAATHTPENAVDADCLHNICTESYRRFLMAHIVLVLRPSEAASNGTASSADPEESTASHTPVLRWFREGERYNGPTSFRLPTLLGVYMRHKGPKAYPQHIERGLYGETVEYVIAGVPAGQYMCLNRAIVIWGRVSEELLEYSQHSSCTVLHVTIVSVALHRWFLVSAECAAWRVMSSNGISQIVCKPSGTARCIRWAQDPPALSRKDQIKQLLRSWEEVETSGLLFSVPGSLPVAMTVFNPSTGQDRTSLYLRKACREFRFSLRDVPLSEGLDDRALKSAPKVTVHFRVLYFRVHRTDAGDVEETHPDLLISAQPHADGRAVHTRQLRPREDDTTDYEQCAPTMDICWRGRMIVRLSFVCGRACELSKPNP